MSIEESAAVHCSGGQKFFTTTRPGTPAASMIMRGARCGADRGDGVRGATPVAVRRRRGGGGGVPKSSSLDRECCCSLSCFRCSRSRASCRRTSFVTGSIITARTHLQRYERYQYVCGLVITARAGLRSEMMATHLGDSMMRFGSLPSLTRTMTSLWSSWELSMLNKKFGLPEMRV